MKTKRFVGLSILIVGVIAAMFITITVLGRGTKDQIPDTPDSQAIQETIRLSYEIESEVARTFNVSLFSSIYVNDSRGPKITSNALDLVRSVKNDFTLTEDMVGYLDYKIAYYTWREKGALLYEQVWSKARSEGRDYLTEEELQSLVDTSGDVEPPRIYAPRLPTSVAFTPELTFMSITIDNDLSKAVYDDGSQTRETTLVKKDGKWYIAGIRILSSHP